MAAVLTYPSTPLLSYSRRIPWLPLYFERMVLALETVPYISERSQSVSDVTYHYHPPYSRGTLGKEGVVVIPIPVLPVRFLSTRDGLDIFRQRHQEGF